LDAELKYVNPMREGSELLWSQYGLGLTARYHFRDAGDTWWPYVAGGVGAWRHESEFSSFDGGRPRQLEGTNLEVHAGVGLQADLNDRFSMRTELMARLDTDDESLAGQSGYTDLMANIALPSSWVTLLPPSSRPRSSRNRFRSRPAPTWTTTVTASTTATTSARHSQAGQTIGPDGCPVPVSIDLKGVNFDFDKATLRPDAVAILGEAAEILKRTRPAR
jgi:OOP family OmpA-OmpF porin